MGRRDVVNVDTSDGFSILHDGISSCELDSWISSNCHGFTAYITLHEHGIYGLPLCQPKDNEQEAKDILFQFLKDVFGVRRPIKTKRSKNAR